MPHEKSTTWTITISPTDHINDTTVNAVRSLITDISDQHIIVCESETSKRHLHAWMVLRKPKTSSNFSRDLSPKFVNCIHQPHGRAAFKAEQCYNDHWRQTYLIKEETREIISQFVRGTEESEKFIASEYAKRPEPNSLKRVYNKHYTELADDIAPRMLPPESFALNYESVEKYLLTRMFEGKQQYITDPKKMVREVKTVLAFVKYKVDSPSCLEYDYDTIAPKHKRRKL